MNVQVAMLLCNITIGVLMVVFGLWIRHLVNQQIKAKDATIETHESTIKLKNAEITRLKDESAPNIAKAYQTMKKHADQMTAQATSLHEALASERSARLRSGDLSGLKQTLSESTGLIRANEMLVRNVDHALKSETPGFQKLFEAIEKTSGEISAASNELSQDVNEKLARLENA